MEKPLKLFKWLPLIFFISCIDVITQTTIYNSLYFQGGSWMETAIIDSMKMGENSNDFTIQFLVSGGEVDTNEAPALFSLVDSQDSVKLALFRDNGSPKRITWTVNSISDNEEINELDWSDPDMFYLISLIFSENHGVKGYLNNEIFLDTNDNIKAGDTKLMVGVVANKTLTILEHFWYGYVDEIRLWNTQLSDSTIQFQTEHPDKFGEYYRYTVDGEEIETYLDSLIGLWRFNLLEATATIEDESEYSHDGTIYTLPNYSIKLSEKGAQ